MTKLEEKLLELGYKKVAKFNGIIKIYEKYENFTHFIVKLEENNIYDYYIYEEAFVVRNQRAIDLLQQAFDIMKKDLEELRKYETNS